jgi:hypothetical protein
MKKLSLLVLGLLLIVGALPLQAAVSTPNKTVADTACMGQAVALREAAVSGAYQKMTASVVNAIAARGNDLASAWTITNAKQRQAAIKKAWDKYNSARKAAVKTYRADITNAWNKYKANAKTCKIGGQAVNVGTDEPSGQKIDNALE